MIPGLHHVTAIASEPQPIFDFYTGFLGLRMVKKTINFDDPGTYHLYFGDRRGSPGTILTFFPWPGARRGRTGPGQTSVVSFVAPHGSLDFWNERARQFGAAVSGRVSRFGEEALAMTDPDGMVIEVVAGDSANERWWDQAGVPGEYAIRGFHSVTLAEEGFERTAELLTGTMDFRRGPEEGNRFRFETGAGGPGSIVDLLCIPAGHRAMQGAGTVHHIAFRTPDDASQLLWRAKLAGAGLNVTPVIDRNYFHSIYFREPGGVLFEIATDPPGFAIDEPAESLGTTLKLPEWYEPVRGDIEAALPPLKTSGVHA